MNDFLPDKDRDLVDFLQKHRPLPPESHPQLEKQLMELVSRQPQESSKNIFHLFWAVPGVIVMGLVVTWNSYRFFNPQPQLARDNANLELFLVNSWKATIEEDYSFSTTPEADIYQLLSTVESPQIISSTTVK